jgi:hypothetical protein
MNEEIQIVILDDSRVKVIKYFDSNLYVVFDWLTDLFLGTVPESALVFAKE